jgi:hypothetical protein
MKIFFILLICRRYVVKKAGEWVKRSVLLFLAALVSIGAIWHPICVYLL